MQIQDNKKLWFHRRLMAYIFLIFCILCVILAYNTSPEKMQHLKEIFWVFIGGGILYIIAYAILSTIHDANIIPQLLEVLKK